MAQTINMQLMRYINLFEKICRVRTTHCFAYNNILIFAVPKDRVSKAVGKNGINVRRIGEILRKKVKIVSLPANESGLEKFVEDIVSPITFNKIELKDKTVIISAGRQSKAALIGRGRIREQELEGILRVVFGIEKLRII